MKTRSILLVLAAAALAAPAMAQRYMPGSDPERPRIMYADSMVSVNDRCIVAKRKLNTSVRPVYVNQQPVGFC